MIMYFKEAREKWESDYIKAALVESAGNSAKAARLCNIPLRTFFDKLKKYSLGRHLPVDTEKCCECATAPIEQIKWHDEILSFYCTVCKKITNPKYHNYYAKTLEEIS